VSKARIDAPWLGWPSTRAVMAALGGEAWFVGGCVRNALIGRHVSDIDLATPLRPEAVCARLTASGLKAVPTGMEHGTVTAVARGRGFEITTFRADVATFGRRAEVRFSTDLAEDAARRDFTMNALYADAGGRVIDPLGGLADLRARRVRFIGDAATRIAEDYLRILRFFRFTAWYARDGIDPAGLAACTRLAPGLDAIARERIGAEITRLLAAPDPAPAVAAMEGAGVLARCLHGARADRLPALVAAEKRIGAAPDWHRRLAVLDAADPGPALRLSRADARQVARIAALADSPHGPAVLAADSDAATARSAMLLRAALGGQAPPEDLEAELSRGAAAVFPLAAADLIGAGLRRGPALGRALAHARAAWHASGLTLDREALIAIALEKGQKE